MPYFSTDALPSNIVLDRYTYVDFKSSKYWEIGYSYKTVYVRYGKMNSTGTNMTETIKSAHCYDNAHVLAFIKQKIAEKKRKGYNLASSLAQPQQKGPTVDEIKEMFAVAARELRKRIPGEIIITTLSPEFVQVKA